jgi:putative FmdB family regulatory protein
MTGTPGVFMPIYEFECSGCGHRFDRLQKLSDADPTVCPACAAAKLHRRVSAPAFRLAGSGWYETDFKKDGDKKRNLAEGSHSSHSSHGSDAAKPAAASPAPAAAAAKAASSD